MTTRPATSQATINRAARELLDFLARRDEEGLDVDVIDEAEKATQMATQDWRGRARR